MSTLLLVFGIILIGSCLQRVAGMGMGMVAGPVLSLAMGPVAGIMVVNVLAVINALLIMSTVWRDINWRRGAMMCSVLILGTIPGAILVQQAPVDVLQVIVGSLLLLGLGMTIFGARLIPEVSGRAPVYAAGIAGGFMNTVAGLAGSAITVYAQAARWEQREYAATLQPIFALAALLSVVIKTAIGAGNPADSDPWIWVVGMGAILLGIAAGSLLSERVSRTTARRIALMAATAGGVSVLLRGTVGMLGA
ncbi:TSUP family transporter [Corynebacterium sp. A21]|uniref:TSUP family transporter n=1 Tax=Corynebacterium sp. A21 TaxID=3457318 RepID=UPI003FD4F07C